MLLMFLLKNMQMQL